MIGGLLMLCSKKRVVTPDELLSLAQAARGKINTIYLHWTAGNYGHCYDDYHLCVDKDGTIEAPAGMVDLAEKKAHTWLRNTGAVGIAIEAARGAKISRDGLISFCKQAVPTPEQIKSMARAVAIICRGADIPISADTVMTHAEVADMDGYGIYDNDPDMRWDLLRLPFAHGISGGDVIRELASRV